MEENPYKARRLLAAFCTVVACVRALMWFIGGMRVLVVPERRENLLAIIVFVVWPGLAVFDWGATAMAIRRNRRAFAALGFAVGICDLIALALVESPLEM